jgi:uncharacterized membrane protein YcaP (DUF421 family)
MIYQLSDWMRMALGLDLQPEALSFWQMALRAIIVFIVALVIVRLANRRFLAHRTAFDAILGFILASVLSRAVNGSSSFFPTLGAGFVLVGVHRLMAAIAFRSHRFSLLVKGKEGLIVEEGQIDEQKMRSHSLTYGDLMEDLRLGAHVDDLAEVKAARVERSGAISIIRRSRTT